jgi:hypothetical protein
MIEEPLNELSCKIFVAADSAQRELAEFLAEGSTNESSSGPASSVIKSALGELELRRNLERDEVSARVFPDGFLHFQYVLEFYRHPELKHEEEVEYVARLLDRLWSHMLPAVASCDYENELPFQGGYKESSLPWPSAVLTGDLLPEHSR